MRTLSLAGTAFAALLIASPGLALAATGAANASNADHGVTTNAPVNGANTGDNVTGHRAMTANAGGYAENETGGFTGTDMPIQANGNHNNSSNNATNMRPSQRNPLLADNGTVRVGKLIGTDVYDSQNHEIGSVNGVLIGKNNQVWAVISHNDRKVTVPFEKLAFGDSHVNSHDKVVLPDITQAQLNSMPVFHYKATNYANGNGTGNGTNYRG